MLILPDFPAPKNIKAACTTRLGGVSQAPYDSFNLAMHVGDNPNDVIVNRQRLKKILNLPSEPMWLKQEHTNKVCILSGKEASSSLSEAQDGSYFELTALNDASPVLAVLTADCLPVLICNKQSTEIAALHAGWRGLLQGIIPAGVSKFKSSPNDLLVWLGPAIGPNAFEVGAEVREQFIAKQPFSAMSFTQTSADSRQYFMNLHQVARQQLNRLGIKNIYGGDFCTYSDEKRFYSYRRQHPTGRMASLIWISHVYW